jgi:hypothetical protein
MLRVDTQESAIAARIASKLFWLSFNCKKQTGIYQVSESKSTRSIYISYLNFITNKEVKIRVSDHRSSIRFGTDADFNYSFEQFNSDFKNIIRQAKLSIN